MQHFVALDIGGTSIKSGIIDKDGKIVSHSIRPTKIQEGMTNFVSSVKNIVEAEIKSDYAISGIGISTAGVVDSTTGEIVHVSPTMPGYRGTNLKKMLEETFQIPIIIENDVNSAALGEAWVGAGESIDTFFCLTLGTGIGGAFILNNELYRGKNFRGGEIGYMGKQSENDLPYEQKAATSALIKYAKQDLNTDGVDGQTIFEQAKAGDPQYENIVRKWSQEIAKGMASVVCILDPGVIVVGGAVSQQGSYLMDLIKDALRSLLPKVFVDSTIIKSAECGNAAGMLGAVYPFVK